MNFKKLDQQVFSLNSWCRIEVFGKKLSLFRRTDERQNIIV